MTGAELSKLPGPFHKNEKKERIVLLACRLKLDDAVWVSRCHGKLRGSLISAALTVKTRRHARPSPPQHFGERKERSPSLAGVDCRISTGSVGAAVPSVWSVRLRQATGTVWPKSQMVFRAVGALLSQRLKKLSAPTLSLLWLKVEADSSSLTHTIVQQWAGTSKQPLMLYFFLLMLPSWPGLPRTRGFQRQWDQPD